MHCLSRVNGGLPVAKCIPQTRSESQLCLTHKITRLHLFCSLFTAKVIDDFVLPASTGPHPETILWIEAQGLLCQSDGTWVIIGQLNKGKVEVNSWYLPSEFSVGVLSLILEMECVGLLNFSCKGQRFQLGLLALGRVKPYLYFSKLRWQSECAMS